VTLLYWPQFDWRHTGRPDLHRQDRVALFRGARMTDRTLTLPTTDRRIEHRAFAAAADAEAGSFSGYASTYWDVDSYGTAFAPGAFAKTLQERADKVVVLWGHDSYQPIGRPTRMEEDGKGLSVDARITEATSAGRDAMALLRDGVPLGLSIGFRTVRERPVDLERDPIVLDNAPSAIRANPDQAVVIEEAKLYEFSVVAFPANEAAAISSVRDAASLDALSTLITQLRHGRISPAVESLVSELVAAWHQAPDGARPAPRQAKAPRKRTDAALVVARWGHYIRNVEV